MILYRSLKEKTENCPPPKKNQKKQNSLCTYQVTIIFFYVEIFTQTDLTDLENELRMIYRFCFDQFPFSILTFFKTVEEDERLISRFPKTKDFKIPDDSS